MTPQDVVDVVGLLAVAFAQKASPETFEVYEAALGDLDVEDPRALVLNLLKTMERWPSPATLRKAILASHGALGMDEDQAWMIATQAASKADTEWDRLPYAIREAVATVGGSWSWKMESRGTLHAQFRDAYRLAKAREDSEALSRSWKGLALTRGGQLGLRDGRVLELDPGGGREQ